MLWHSTMEPDPGSSRPHLRDLRQVPWTPFRPSRSQCRQIASGGLGWQNIGSGPTERQLCDLHSSTTVGRYPVQCCKSVLAHSYRVQSIRGGEGGELCFPVPGGQLGGIGVQLPMAVSSSPGSPWGLLGGMQKHPKTAGLSQGRQPPTKIIHVYSLVPF